MTIDDLRSAILNRDFVLAQTLISEWGKAVAQDMKSAADESDKRRIYEQAIAAGQQNLYLARVVRAHIASELLANSASFLYSDADLEQPRWRLSA